MRVFEIDNFISYNETIINEFIRKSYENNIVQISSQIKIPAKVYTHEDKIYICLLNPSTNKLIAFTLYLNTAILYMNWIDDKLFIVLYHINRLRFSIMIPNENVLQEGKFLEFTEININSFKSNYDTNSIYFLYENFILRIQGKDLEMKKVHYIEPGKTIFIQSGLYFQYQTDKNICIVGYLDTKSEIFNTITITNSTGLDFNDIEYTFLDSKILLNLFESKIYFLKIL